jgi:ribokinase
VAADRHAGGQRGRSPHAQRPDGRIARGRRHRGPGAAPARRRSRGAGAVDADGARHHGAPKGEGVDTTAAGDTFLGALAVALARDGGDLDAAVRLGIRAGALCVTRPGAQPSIPWRDDVLRSPLPPEAIVL